MTIRRRLARSNLVMILIPVAIAAVLLLLDLMLPGVDGFTICRQVREQKKLPILMVSASARTTILKSRFPRACSSRA